LLQPQQLLSAFFFLAKCVFHLQPSPLWLSQLINHHFSKKDQQIFIAFTTSNIFIPWRNKYLGVDSQISFSNVYTPNSRYVFVTAPLPSTECGHVKKELFTFAFSDQYYYHS